MNQSVEVKNGACFLQISLVLEYNCFYHHHCHQCLLTSKWIYSFGTGIHIFFNIFKAVFLFLLYKMGILGTKWIIHLQKQSALVTVIMFMLLTELLLYCPRTLCRGRFRYCFFVLYFTYAHACSGCMKL